MSTMRRVGCGLVTLAALTALTAPAQAQVKIEYRYPEGKTIHNTTRSKVAQTLSIAGQNIETTSEESSTSTETIGQRAADGLLPIGVKVEALKANIGLPMGLRIEFDSANPDAKQDLPVPQLAAMVEMLKVLAGTSYDLKVDKAGEVVAVEGVDAVVKKAEERNPQLGTAIKARLDLEAIKKRSAESRAKYPGETLVRPGETWNRTETLGLGAGQIMTFEKTYEYTGTVEKDGKTLDRITVKVTGVKLAQDAPGDSPAKLTRSDLTIKASEGTILFDRGLGQPVETSEAVQIAGDLTMQINGMALDAQLDLKLETGATARAE